MAYSDDQVTFMKFFCFFYFNMLIRRSGDRQLDKCQIIFLIQKNYPDDLFSYQSAFHYYLLVVTHYMFVGDDDMIIRQGKASTCIIRSSDLNYIVSVFFYNAFHFDFCI